MTQQKQHQLSFLKGLAPRAEPKRLPSIPFEFACLPTDIIAKQFTKLNSPHAFRIHYLGPRPSHSYLLHKRLGQHFTPQPRGPAYQLSLRSVANHCLTNREKLQGQNQCFYRAFEGTNPTLKGEDCLVFSSGFEGGNLDCAVKVGSAEFDLFLRVDSNSLGHSGWFYFSVKNGSRTGTVRFNLCNLRKRPRLYHQGMAPFVLSSRAQAQHQQNWLQGCTNITLEPAALRYNFLHERIEDQLYHRLGFDYEFQHEQDQVFFAYCIPYTYSRLQTDIEAYAESQAVREYALGHSLAGLELPLLHVTDFGTTSAQKSYAVIVGRVHPSEANSSHVIHGLVSWLVGSSKEAEQLRKQLHFFIVPMLNPDGVVLGNTRTSASGKDLNRQFTSQNAELFPEVAAVKQLVSRLQSTGKVMLYLDFHGHSMRKNTFSYGPNYPLAHNDFLRCRLLPRLIQKMEPSFRYYSCSFALPEQKRKTARAVMLEHFKIPFVYTIESSNGLYYDPKEMKTVAFSEEAWNEMGKAIAKALATFAALLSQSQALLKERKYNREAKRRDKALFFVERKLGSQKSEGLFQLPKKAAQTYCELISQIKTLVLNERKADDSADSDDYDQAEDIPSKKLSSLTTALHHYKRQYLTSATSATHWKSSINDFEVVVPTFPVDYQDCSQGQPSLDMLEAKGSHSLGGYQKKRNSRAVHPQGKKPPVGRLLQRNVSELGEWKRCIAVGVKKQAAALTVYPQKPRYSLVNGNSLLLVQSKFQSFQITRDLRALRRQMKKGRLLISNLEQNRLKFVSLQHESQQRRGARGRVRRPTTSCVKSAKVDLSEQVQLRPNQPCLHAIEHFVAAHEQPGLSIRPLKRKF